MSPSPRDRERIAARRAEVLVLRAAGATWPQIAKQLGHKTPAAAAQDGTRALKERRAELAASAELFVTLEAVKLDALERQCNTIARRPGADPWLVLRTIDRLIRIAERRAALHALDGRPVAGKPGRAAPDDPKEGARDEIAARRAARRAAAAGE